MAAKPSPFWELVKYGGLALFVIALAGLIVGALQSAGDAPSPWQRLADDVMLQILAWPLIVGALSWLVGHNMLKSAGDDTPRPPNG